MPTVDPADIIWIQDAVKESGKSREWFDKQLKGRLLSVVKMPADGRVYLLRSEIADLLEPRIVKPREDNVG